MRLSTIIVDKENEVAIKTIKGFVRLTTVNTKIGKTWPLNLFDLLNSSGYAELKRWYEGAGREAIEEMDTLQEVTYGKLIDKPVKIIGIGLNFREHAVDLETKPPTRFPGSFIKTPNTVVAPGGKFLLPRIGEVTTGEGELVLVFIKKAHHVPAEKWMEYVAFTGSIDGTIERPFLMGLDANPRNLSASKIFDDSLVIGPEMVSSDELTVDPLDIEVATVCNGTTMRKNTVRNMAFRPDQLVAYFTQLAVFHPGDMITTGTPGAAPLKDGDVISCRLNGLGEFPELSAVAVTEKRSS